MADDIVTRLRDRHATTWPSGSLTSIFSAAADEIERLRAEKASLTEVGAYCVVHHGPDSILNPGCEMANGRPDTCRFVATWAYAEGAETDAALRSVDVFNRLVAENGRLRAVIAQAVTELDDEHRDGDEAARGRHGGCVICWPADGSWPCVTRMVADDLRKASEDGAR